MSNTIRQPRKRPRVTSCNFRALGWLIRREAAFKILAPLMYLDSPEPHRRTFAMRDWRWLERRARNPFHFYPGGRYLP